MATKDETMAMHALAAQVLLDSLLFQLVKTGALSPADLREIGERAIDRTHATDAVLSALVEQHLKGWLATIPPSP